MSNRKSKIESKIGATGSDAAVGDGDGDDNQSPAEHAMHQEQEQHIQRNTRTPKSKSPCEAGLHFSPFSCYNGRYIIVIIQN
jgi:hypothetical protein